MNSLDTLRAKRLKLIESIAEAADQMAVIDSEIEKSNMQKLGDDGFEE